MNKKHLNFLSNKWIKWGVIPLLLLLLWLITAISLLLNTSLSFTVLSNNLPANNLTVTPEDKLLKGETISGQFIARENYLGIVSIRFKTYPRVGFVDEDVLLFRIKERGSNNWYYENTYKSGLIYGNLLFPFGFSPIQNSKGKIYDFEVESLQGNDQNAISLGEENPLVVVSYQYPKSELLHSPISFVSFLVKKFLYSLSSPDIIFFYIIFSFPLFFYLYLQTLRKKVTSDKYLLFFIVQFFSIVDIFKVTDVTADVYAIVVYLILICYFYNFESSIYFFVSLFYLLISLLLLPFGKMLYLERSSFWLYILLALGIFRLLWDIAAQRKATTLQVFLKTLSGKGESRGE